MDREMRQQLSCSVCLDLYTDPVLLPCLHSLCEECVHNLLQAAITECPECKTPFRTSGKKVPFKRNFPLNSLVQIYKRAETENSFTRPPQNMYPNISAMASNDGIQGQTNTGTTTEFANYHANPEITSESITDQTNLRTTSETAKLENTAPNRGNVQQRVCSTCDSGSASQAAVYCSTCTLSFCTACLHSLHPQGSEHEFLSVADLDKISLCVICETAASQRCLQCKMAFCTPCLASYHPTTTSGQGHMLMKVKVNVTSYNLTSKDTPPPLPPRRYRPTTSKPSKGSSKPVLMGDNSSFTSGTKKFTSLEISRDVREATLERHCGLCADTHRVEAVFRCLDCSASMCRNCVFTHRQDAPSHTLINIAIPRGRGPTQVSPASQQQVSRQHELQPESSFEFPGQSLNNVQKGLVELMGTKSDVMEELVDTLGTRNMSEGNVKL